MKNIWILIIFSGFFFFLGNNLISLTNPDEVFYVQTACEMAQKNTWSVPYLFGQPQFEKPVLTYDLLRLAFLLAGPTPFAARFFPALFALAGVLLVYAFGVMAFQDRRAGFLGSIMLMSAFLYAGMARTVFTDTIFSVFIAAALVSFYWGYARETRRDRAFVLFFVFSALAVLSKGPLGFLIPLGVVLVFLGIRGELVVLRRGASFFGLLIFLLLALPWYIVMVQEYGDQFIREFFVNDHWRRLLEAEHAHNDKWYFYPVVMLGGMFPWHAFVAGAFVLYIQKLLARRLTPARTFLLVWVAVVFVVFQCAHSKLVSYIMPLFPALALMAGDLAVRGIRREGASIRTIFYGSVVGVLAIPVVLVVAARRYPMYFPSNLQSFLFGLLFVVMAGVVVVLVRRKKYLAGFYVLAAQALIVFGLIFMSAGHFEDHVSSRSAVRFLKEQADVSGKILCSKMYVRGVRFYSGAEVAVINIGGSQFFSPHPVVYIASSAELVDFLRTQPLTYGVVAKSSWKVIEETARINGWSAELLKIFGNEYVVRIKR